MVSATDDWNGERREIFAARGEPSDLSHIGTAQPLFEFLDHLGQEVARCGDANEVMTVTTRLTAGHLGVSNCAYADMDDDEDGFTIRGNWHDERSPSIVGRYRLADFGTLAVRELRAGRPLIINDNLREIAPEEAKTFQDIGIAATICMPLIKGDRLVALMAIHDSKPHFWSDYEKAVILEVTTRSWAHVERVRSEAELRASNDRFRAAMRAIEGVLWTNDASGQMVGEQPGWAALTGQSLAQYQGYGWADAVHPDDAQPTVDAWNRAVANRETFVFEHRLRCANGDWRRFSVKAIPILDAAGAVTEWVGVHSDITAERAAQEALRERTRDLETLNRIGSALSAEFDVERIVQIVTDAGVELTGAQFGAFFYTAIDDSGERLTLYTLSGADRSDFERFGHPRPTGVFAPTFNGEGAIRSPDITKDPRYGLMGPHFGMPPGHLPVRSYLAVPVMSRSGEVFGGLFFGHSEPDMFTQASERLMQGMAGQTAVAIENGRLLEQQQRANATLEQRVVERTSELELAHEALRQSQKMEAIGQLTGGIAHDFNNLLTVICGSADRLRQADLTDERRRRYVDAIAQTADRAARLTGQLLAFARRQALKPELFDAAARIESLAEMLRSILGSRIQLVIEALCDDCLVKADPSQFETSIINMAVNARDAMNGEGRLSISIGSAHDDSGAKVVTRIADSGAGIAEAELPHIFEPFFTTKGVGKGTGLGLSQVYGFAKQSDGEITVESDFGEGTTFALILPKYAAEAAAEVPTQTPPAMFEANRHILIVEDNADVGQFAAQLLQDLGFRTTLAGNGHEGLEAMEAAGGTFDYIFSDVVMPGMGGLEFGARVRQKWPRIPIVLTSGYSDVLASGAGRDFPLLQKPYTAEALARILQEAGA